MSQPLSEIVTQHDPGPAGSSAGDPSGSGAQYVRLPGDSEDFEATAVTGPTSNPLRWPVNLVTGARRGRHPDVAPHQTALAEADPPQHMTPDADRAWAAARQNPDARLWVYRCLPARYSTIEAGDWVALDWHGTQCVMTGRRWRWHVIAAQVPAYTLYAHRSQTPGFSWSFLGYQGPAVEAREVNGPPIRGLYRGGPIQPGDWVTTRKAVDQTFLSLVVGVDDTTVEVKVGPYTSRYRRVDVSRYEPHTLAAQSPPTFS